MRTCMYCGRENEDAMFRCVGCGSEFESKEAVDPRLTDPASALVPVGQFADLIHATLLKNELVLAGIPACIPEEFSANPFGEFNPLTQFTVQVAARDVDFARGIISAQSPSAVPVGGP